MKHFLSRLPAPERVIARQLEEAKVAALEHEAAGEHHLAMARMYRGREQRLISLTKTAPIHHLRERSQ